MIRVNLLPGDKKRRAPRMGGGGGGSQSAGMWAGIFAAAILGWVACLGGVYLMSKAKLDNLQEDNAKLETRRDALQRKTKGLAEVEKQLKRSKELEEIVEKLNRARTGPTRALMELSHVLSSPGGPTIDPDMLETMRKEDPLAGYNEGWDVRRIWLKTFAETEGVCKIEGVGRSEADVSEFSRRLDLSDLFSDVDLLRTRSIKDDKTDLPMVGFELACKVRY